MKLFEVIFKIELDNIPFEHQYNSFLTIQVEGNVESDGEAVDKAYVYAANVLGIERSNLHLVSVDEL